MAKVVSKKISSKYHVYEVRMPINDDCSVEFVKELLLDMVKQYGISFEDSRIMENNHQIFYIQCNKSSLKKVIYYLENNLYNLWEE